MIASEPAKISSWRTAYRPARRRARWRRTRGRRRAPTIWAVVSASSYLALVLEEAMQDDAEHRDHRDDRARPCRRWRRARPSAPSAGLRCRGRCRCSRRPPARGRRSARRARASASSYACACAALCGSVDARHGLDCHRVGNRVLDHKAGGREQRREHEPARRRSSPRASRPVWPIRPTMMSRLAAIIDAPGHTSAAFRRQIRSTRWPTGIFSAHGIPVQKSERGKELPATGRGSP